MSPVDGIRETAGSNGRQTVDKWETLSEKNIYILISRVRLSTGDSRETLGDKTGDNGKQRETNGGQMGDTFRKEYFQTRSV